MNKILCNLEPKIETKCVNERYTLTTSEFKKKKKRQESYQYNIYIKCLGKHKLSLMDTNSLHQAASGEVEDIYIYAYICVYICIYIHMYIHIHCALLHFHCQKCKHSQVVQVYSWKPRGAPTRGPERLDRVSWDRFRAAEREELRSLCFHFM